MLRINAFPWGIVLAATIILACNTGIRQTTGLLLPDISLGLNIPASDVAFGFGVQNLLWGLITPFAGILAERFGTLRILLLGALAYALGLILAALSHDSTIFFISNAFIIGVGVGVTTYPIVLAAVARSTGEHNRTFALGLASAGGSMGQFLYAMSMSWLNSTFSWSQTYLLFAATTVFICVFSWFLRDPPCQQRSSVQVGFDWSVVRNAFRNRDYLLLNAGFLVCGFHIAILTVHMSGLVSYCGLPPEVASNSLALIGLVNVGGVILVGWAGDRWHKPWLLALIYWLRTALIMALILAPVSTQLFYLFSIAMGMLWLSTVPLTSGCVASIFGSRNLASLFGFVMLSHQVGAFLGSWWGGIIVEQSGSYALALMISAALGLLAAAIHLPLTPERFVRYQPA